MFRRLFLTFDLHCSQNECRSTRESLMFQTPQPDVDAAVWNRYLAILAHNLAGLHPEAQLDSLL